MNRPIRTQIPNLTLSVDMSSLSLNMSRRNPLYSRIQYSISTSRYT